MNRTPMLALSVRPPYAQFIIWGIPLFESVDNANGSTSVKLSGDVVLKNVENRTWGLPKGFKLPQRIYIHASKRDDPIESVLELCVHEMGLPFMVVMAMTSPLLGRGALIGEVDIVGCIRDSKSPWAVPGQYHFILKNPRGYKVTVPCKGRLGFFLPDFDMLSEMKKMEVKP